MFKYTSHTHAHHTHTERETEEKQLLYVNYFLSPFGANTKLFILK